MEGKVENLADPQEKENPRRSPPRLYHAGLGSSCVFISGLWLGVRDRSVERAMDVNPSICRPGVPAVAGNHTQI